MDKKFSNNLQVNIALADTIKRYLSSFQTVDDWSQIDPELQKAINKVTAELSSAMAMSDKACSALAGCEIDHNTRPIIAPPGMVISD